MRAILAAVVIAVFTGQGLWAGDWPQFRGPRGDGHSDAQNLPTTWGGFLEPPAWQVEIPGTGWSSPIVIDDRVWLTTAELTALANEPPAPKLTQNLGGQIEPLKAYATVSLSAIELDATSGKILRQLRLFTGEDPASIHSANTYASPTPVTDGERILLPFRISGHVCRFADNGTDCMAKAFCRPGYHRSR